MVCGGDRVRAGRAVLALAGRMCVGVSSMISYKKERVPTLLLGEREYVFLLKFEQHHNVATYSPNEGNYIKQEQNLMMEENRVVCECVRVAFSMPQREAMKHFIINVY